MTAMIALATALAAASPSHVLRYHEGISGVWLNHTDLSRMVMASGQVGRLPAGIYDIGLVMPRTPLFYLGSMNAPGRTGEKPFRLVWNSRAKVRGHYLEVASLPQFDWARYPLRNYRRYSIVFLSVKKSSMVPVLELRGDLRRDQHAFRPAPQVRWVTAPGAPRQDQKASPTVR